MAAVTKAVIYDRFLPALQLEVKASTPFNIYTIFSAATMDFVTGYLFGLQSSSNWLQDEGHRSKILELYNSRKGYVFWPQEMPGLTFFLERIGVRTVPRRVNDANKEIEDWVLDMCDGAKEFLAQSKGNSADKLPPEEAANFPVVFSQLESGMGKSISKGEIAYSPERQRLEIASEVLDHLAAGFDTSGITLTYLIHEMSRRADLQASLRKELLTLNPPVSLHSISANGSPALPSPKSFEVLPLLNAIMDETLRLRAAIPGPEPRITPPWRMYSRAKRRVPEYPRRREDFCIRPLSPSKSRSI